MDELTLRPMTTEEFAEFERHSAHHYAAEKVSAGSWPAAGAVARAERDGRRLLPEGLDTPGMLLLIAELGGEPAGRVWLAPHPDGLPDAAWIYDIEVDEPRRGQGVGRALLAAAERVAREHGYTAIGLNVFGANAVARNLYESSGYGATSIQMAKPIA